MYLDRRRVLALLESVAQTRDDEIDCDACLLDLAEFAECQLLGAELPTALARVEAHIAGCPECREEYEVLLDVLRDARRG
ncbi:MAG: hypothetical protein R3F35_17685 [Myxococcota bacterium]